MDWKVAEPDEMQDIIDILDMSFPVGKAYIQKSLAAETEIETYRLRVDGELIATATYGQCFADEGWNGEAYIRFLAVHPDHRRKGHASRIIQKIMDAMQAAGSPCVCISVLSADVRLAEMWKRRGFEVYSADVVKDQPNNQPHDYYVCWFKEPE